MNQLSTVRREHKKKGTKNCGKPVELQKACEVLQQTAQKQFENCTNCESKIPKNSTKDNSPAILESKDLQREADEADAQLINEYFGNRVRIGSYSKFGPISTQSFEATNLLLIQIKY